jgi:hypothetical protein
MPEPGVDTSGVAGGEAPKQLHNEKYSCKMTIHSNLLLGMNACAQRQTARDVGMGALLACLILR